MLYCSDAAVGTIVAFLYGDRNESLVMKCGLVR